jgi:polysaccharide pyruvyl transferase WcaK-like protein
MIIRGQRGSAAPASRPPRVGVFGLLGSGNLGNDGSLAVVLAFLRERHPDAVVDFMCMGPRTITERYGRSAIPLHWYYAKERSGGRLWTVVQKSVGKLIDLPRTFRWVRRHDVVIVPGMGVLEAELPLHAWGFPYMLLLVSLAGRLFGTKVALVSVGANVMRARLTRWFFGLAARLARYRSFRDEPSRAAVHTMGVDTTADPVYPDLVYAMPVPHTEPAAESDTVGVGVMSYYGGNDDRARADEIHADYLAKISEFVVWLADAQRPVRLFVGDRTDLESADAVLAYVQDRRPDAEISVVPLSSLEDVLREMVFVRSVVATRYHNVLCALKLARPTVSLAYAPKNDVLMRDMGLGDYCQHLRSFDLEWLKKQFVDVERRAEELRAGMIRRHEQFAAELDGQFRMLSATLFRTRGAAA